VVEDVSAGVLLELDEVSLVVALVSLDVVELDD
jgi:hypothetical protein